MLEGMDRTALAEFLRARRASLTPADVGLPQGARRRAPGLRREEVAQLAVMSVDYYARLEQRRGPQPSTQMLAALARALRLTADERDYLHRVSGHAAPDRIAAGDHIAPGLLRVFDRLSDTPALIISDVGDALAQNRLASAFFGDHTARSGLERSDVYRWFASPETARSAYPASDHARQSRALVSSLRVAYGAKGPASRAGEIVRALERESEEFSGLWARQEVSRRFEDHKVLLHPEVGAVELDCQVLFTEDQSQALLVLTAEPGSEAEQRIRLLEVLAVG